MTIENLMIQIALIVAAARTCGALLRWLGQSEVIGEMLGGILIGPSLLGMVDHGRLLHWFFPHGSMPFLDLLSQLGVMFFMFTVGLELDLGKLRGKGRAVVVTGLTSVVGPLIVGIILSVGLLSHPSVTGTIHSKLAFVAMLGTALGLSAFPVLAKRIRDRALHKTPLGTFTLASAAVLDLTGWCVLALTYDLAKTRLDGSHTSLWMTGLLGLKTAVLAAAYVVVMMFFVRRFLWRFQAHFQVRGYLSRDLLALAIFSLFISALVASSLGINPVFGAFMMGLIFPSDELFVTRVTASVEDLTLLVLLPIFFASVGLHINIAEIHTAGAWKLWLSLVGILFTAKFFFSFLPARIMALGWKDAGMFGLLLNTHGVVELVVLNLAFQLHAISERTMTVAVFALLAVTLISSIISSLAEIPTRRSAIRRGMESATTDGKLPAETHILVCLSQPTTAVSLVRAAARLLAGQPGRLTLLQLISPSASLAITGQEIKTQDAGDMAQREAQEAGVPVSVLTLPTLRIARDITLVARHHHADWIVLGSHRGILDPSALGGVVDHVLKRAKANVAILVTKTPKPIENVLVPYLGEAQDAGALLAAYRISRSPKVQITILHVVSPSRRGSDQPLGVAAMVEKYLPNVDGGNQIRMQVIESDHPVDVVLEKSREFDLMILGLSPLWKLRHNLLGAAQRSVAQLAGCSLLIVRAAENSGVSG
ncbi:MAG: cation:proton antiporter [Phycisphaerae bacterium]